MGSLEDHFTHSSLSDTDGDRLNIPCSAEQVIAKVLSVWGILLLIYVFYQPDVTHGAALFPVFGLLTSNLADKG